MEGKDLVDERREQLGDEKEFTRTGDGAAAETSTRLDRWYIPGETDMLVTFSVDNDFIFKLHSSDHSAVHCTATSLVTSLVTSPRY